MSDNTMKHYWVDLESGISVGADLWDDGMYESEGNEVWVTKEPEFYQYIAYSSDGEDLIKVTKSMIEEATPYLSNMYWNDFS